MRIKTSPDSLIGMSGLAAYPARQTSGGSAPTQLIRHDAGHVRSSRYAARTRCRSSPGEGRHGTRRIAHSQDLLCRHQSTKRRIELARAMLEPATTPNSIELIAKDVGFESSAVFRRAFKRVLGMSPQTYRSTRVGNGHFLRPPYVITRSRAARTSPASICSLSRSLSRARYMSSARSISSVPTSRLCSAKRAIFTADSSTSRTM